MRRRAFLTGLAATVTPLPGLAYSSSRVGLDRIWMRRNGIKEEISVSLQHETLEEARLALAEISWFFRDWKDRDASLWIDPDLIHILAGVQVMASAQSGRDKCLILTSGYRTPERNATIRGAAADSLHMRGKAGDILIDGFSSSQIGALGRRAGAGGVGVYSGQGFAHLDSGPVRNWGR